MVHMSTQFCLFGIRSPQGACGLGRALLLLSSSATEKCILCKFGGLEIVHFKVQCATGHATDRPMHGTQMPASQEMAELGAGKPPSVPCLGKEFFLYPVLPPGQKWMRPWVG